MARKPAFEQSKFDNDKGLKEGGKADMKRDAKEKKAMPSMAKGKKGEAPHRGGRDEKRGR